MASVYYVLLPLYIVNYFILKLINLWLFILLHTLARHSEAT